MLTGHLRLIWNYGYRQEIQIIGVKLDPDNFEDTIYLLLV